MNPIKLLAAVAILAAGTAAAALPASAQATRTWVSGVGDDANPCSRTAPCKTFAGAISKTATGGEINCIDPGGFGAVSITKSMAIICDEVEAGILVSSGAGVIVNIATPGGVVYLSGLDFEGLNSGTSGVNILSADTTVTVRNSIIRGFATAGISAVPSSGAVQLVVDNTALSDNTGAGINIRPTGSGSVRFAVSDSTLSHNGSDGLLANANVTTGNIKGSVLNSTASHNGADGISAFSGSGVDQVLIDSSTITNNNRGLNASGNKATLRFTRTTVTANGTGVNQDTSGQALSYGTNSVAGNGTDGTFGTTAQN